ncbi:LysR substrate-binding domain-containing protein [Burkholderia pseudomultivorans]|uniref:LysR family transcriptional regulator n=1 Tax=Burkholderia pseudomultivorans TaxID=1207504 RepID=A0A132EYW1_9BURK|nr:MULTISPECIES: LysR substrate-binding domain-containing protein [Burkholderia cepacia complex]KVC20928.1 LysR family transcriptional regulator [Burkholderia pseudomultivorans]KVC39824.1 LysR family transcriptional regulator [Burkholderia pseudomultivorans]KVC50539.1 LysR family transcriptional regulator [Burkholderia pseudomultivorans]KWF64211.1 LysR family transcriptional regulator [Burkholderia pseudomultivorans]KWI47627.1 LysR family transcriptional regulator [Burkholderia pseudomultivora
MSTLPPLRALQVFEAVGRCGGIAEAAKRLGISAGAVSQQMKLLEDTLGLSLLEKDGKRLRLTTAGRRYHERCADAFERLRIAHAEVERARHDRNLRISALPSLLSKWLAPRVIEWQRAYPELSVYLDGTHAEPSPDGCEIDFRISYGDRVADVDNAIELFRDAVVPACSPQLLRECAPLETPADLLPFPLIAIDWQPKFASPPSWQDWFDAHGVDASAASPVRLALSLSSIAIQAAIDGHGFVLAQSSMICDDVAAGRLVVPIASGLPLPWPYFVAWKKSAFDKPECRNFHRWLLTRAREQQEVSDRLVATSATGTV